MSALGDGAIVLVVSAWLIGNTRLLKADWKKSSWRELAPPLVLQAIAAIALVWAFIRP